VAVILAFLFRAFVAEAFVIPTGSMAPTLMGRHKDVICAKCGFAYQAGASIEVDERTSSQGVLQRSVVATMCPICRHQMALDLASEANQASFNGDRILVSKFTYDFSNPKRWDVIVFKYPGNAKQNYIKRLVGLPNETVLIKHGDIFVKKPGDEGFRIARKPDHKLQAMLQIVDDTKHIPQDLIDIGWPSRWQPWAADGIDVTQLWSSRDEGHSFQTDGTPERDIWLRYFHIVPSFEDWGLIEQNQTPPGLDQRSGQLITDFYAYNAYTSVEAFYMDDTDELQAGLQQYAGRPLFGSRHEYPYAPLGLHWVSDLALEGDLEVQGEQGELLLLLVKSGIHYQCRIDAATGKATMSIDGGNGKFTADDGSTAAVREAQTRLRGKGTYRVRFSNIDAELRLWVDDRRVEFDGPTTYESPEDPRPVWSPKEPGDLAPLGIGSRGLALDVQRLRVYRDVYYVATQRTPPHEYLEHYSDPRIWQVLGDPTSWASTPVFDRRNIFEQSLGDDDFFPLGDNSPQSADARLWDEPFVKKDMLIGKALLIYWPHAWNRPIPYLPNFERMGLIR
jgi:signal peptidase I